MVDCVDSQQWRPKASVVQLRRRAEIYRQVREFFHARGVLEVETPILSRFGNTDPNIESYIAWANTRDAHPKINPAGGGAAGDAEYWYLHTSPEFGMKRLLAAGVGPIYQLCKVFRHAEFGRFHNTEFSMLEWYRPGFSYQALMDEVADLVRCLSGEDECLGVEKISYAQAFQATTGIDPHNASLDELKDFVRSRGQHVQGLAMDDRDGWLDLLMGNYVQPELGQGKLTFVYDFPASRAALARVREGSLPLAERFELFINGVELANGYQELTCAREMRRRFKREQEIRKNNNQLSVDYDRYLISAGEHGLPDSAGVALGMDRLVLHICKQDSLQKVLAFNQKNA